MRPFPPSVAAAVIAFSGAAHAAQPATPPGVEPTPEAPPTPTATTTGVAEESSATPTTEPTSAAPVEPEQSPPAVVAAAPEEEPTVLEEDPAAVDEYVAPTKPSSPFDRNRLRLGVAVGWAQTNSTDWFILGGGVGYYVLDGLEVHADANFWLIGSPFIATVTPGVRYVFHMVPDIKPYVGTFYRHYFVDKEGFDSDSIGGRAGIIFMINPRAYVGGGLIVEQLFNNNLFDDATQVYPEVTFAFAI